MRRFGAPTCHRIEHPVQRVGADPVAVNLDAPSHLVPRGATESDVIIVHQGGVSNSESRITTAL